MPTRASHGKRDGFAVVRLESERVAVEVIPELGAKVVSLLDRASRREWLAPPAQAYRRARVGDPFGDFDRSGWDECFPNVGTAPGRDDGLADHGELWSQPWQATVDDEGLTTQLRDPRGRFRFQRTLAVADDRVELGYIVRNEGAEPLECLWSMHPLLAARRGGRVLVPDARAATLDAALSDGLFGGFGARVAWPVATTTAGAQEDLSDVGAREAFALKLFTGRLTRGVAAVCDPGPKPAWLALTWDEAVCPYLGIWLNEGGWPSDAPLHHLALEPTSAPADRLDIARALDPPWLLAPGAAESWRVTLRLGSGEEDLAAALAGYAPAPSASRQENAGA